MYDDLKDKRVVVTGGASGSGIQGNRPNHRGSHGSLEAATGLSARFVNRSKYTGRNFRREHFNIRAICV